MTIKKSMEELGRVAPDAERQVIPVIVILDDVRSMHNVGSVFRTCDAFAVSELWLCGYTPTPPHRDIHKTALGATETVKWRHFKDTMSAVNEAREQGCVVMSVEQAHGSIALQDFTPDSSRPLALVLGNEVEGVNDAVLQASDGCIEIPQYGSKHSLNISVSAGVVLWELVRAAKTGWKY